jgi:hypothetical protein
MLGSADFPSPYLRRNLVISTIKLITSLAIVSALLVGSASSFAKDGDGRVLRTGDCGGRSDWKLKAKHEDGRIETEFEVDQNRNGVTWRYRLRRNGTTVARGTRVTRAPSGSFEVERRIGNPAGTDRITAVATRRGGETCRASLRI